MVKVLIADDMLTVQHNLSFILEAYNFKVIGKASNCSEAVTLCRDRNPDIVLLDILGMDSYFEEERREINSFDTIEILLKENKNLKIVMLTATPKEDFLKRALLLGAKGFLVKGVPNEKIIHTLENIMSR